MDKVQVRFEPLDGHPREAFSCKHRPVQHFFRKWAEDNHASHTQRVFVACQGDSKDPLGFYSLSLMTFEPGMNDETDEKYNGRRIPTIYIGAIARDKNLSQSGFGIVLMEDALRRCLTVRENVGVYALSLHAANESVATIYESYGFSRFANGEVIMDGEGNAMPAMFFKLADAAAAFAEAGI
jgi:predicted acetyltransferase